MTPYDEFGKQLFDDWELDEFKSSTITVCVYRRFKKWFGCSKC
jgi:hypothetical protein